MAGEVFLIPLLALRNLAHRPWRSLLLLLGYGLGVGVMIVLLAIGEALLIQASDERLVGGGDLTVLPEGLDVEVMKTGGVGGMFFSIDNARFIHRQLLASPRLGDDVRTVAPQIEGKLVYLRAGAREWAVRAAGEIPSRNELVEAGAPLVAGSWEDDDGDREWISPTREELLTRIDHFHLPPEDLAAPETWAEWHYFNVISSDAKRWAFISFIVGGDLRVAAARARAAALDGGDIEVRGATSDTTWGGQILVTMHEAGGQARRFTANVRARDIRFSTGDADVQLGDGFVSLLEGGRYAVRARAAEDGRGTPLEVNLIVTPEAGHDFPGATLAECPREGPCTFVSGYAVAALRAKATGSICVGGRCERFEEAAAYHDHNWGLWRGVTWEWGSARAGGYGILYGRVHPPEGEGSIPPLFAYLTDSLGFRALFRPRDITYEDARTITVDGRQVQVPVRAVIGDVRGRDTLRLELEIDDAVGTRVGTAPANGGSVAPGAAAMPYFIQMQGRVKLSGRAGGAPLNGEGIGFFETYRGP